MAGTRIPIKAGAPTSIKAPNVSAKPQFPVGARPRNVGGPRINQHPKPVMGGMGAPPMGAPSPAPAPAGRAYGKSAGGDFSPFGGV